ncbi:MAG: hypothetical protein KatS3mg130_1341 [Candidatus Sumerlaea sp.]|jgi:hypothetical protein|nr:MAG: hypothetical protein KatS3mg130_1341 [Candidatus Sumerlaea sp.]
MLKAARQETQLPLSNIPVGEGCFGAANHLQLPSSLHSSTVSGNYVSLWRDNGRGISTYPIFQPC